MKILFVTEDANCECGGTGFLELTVKAPPDYDPDRQRDEITIRVLCPCVKAMDATLRKFDDVVDDDVTEGIVVPDP